MDVVSYALAKKYVDSNIANITEREQADWNQNDSSARDYVRNRPFYSKTISETASFSPNGSAGISLIVPVSNEFITEIFRHPDTVIVDVDIGNGHILRSSIVVIDDTNVKIKVPENEMFLHYLDVIIRGDLNKKSLEITSHGIAWNKCDITVSYEEICALDEKFIPDTIARVSDILGQSQSDWNQNDPNAKDYVKNRPFYEGYKILGTFLRGENKLKISLTIGKSYIVNCDGVTYTVVCEPLSAAPKGLRIMKEGGGVLFIIYEDFQHVYEADRVVLMDPDKLMAYQLDEKFIPDTIARVNDVGEVASTNEIVDILIQEDMLFAFTDSTGSILTDENNNILTW